MAHRPPLERQNRDRDRDHDPDPNLNRQRRADPPNAGRRLPDDTRIVFLSDCHIGGDRGRDIFESPAELTALLEELAALPGPVELVLAGDFFDFLEIGEVTAGEDRAAATVSRPEYQAVFGALRCFAAGTGRRVVYLLGNHDAEVWWNPAIRETLRREGLVHEFACSYAACFASRPDRIVYCEHGNQFDPANTITDYDDPLDTPFGHHIVTDVMRGIVPAGGARGDQGVHDINKVFPLVAIPEWLAGRLFYDLLTQIGRFLILPLLLAYAAFRVVAYLVAASGDDPLSFWQSTRSLPGTQRLFIEIGYNGALLLLGFGIFFFVIRRVTNRAVASTAARLPGLAQTEASAARIGELLGSDRPTPMGGGLTGREIAVFASGHTHAPSLTHIARDGADPAVAVNSGCWLRQLRPVPAHFATPPVFVSSFVLTHARVSLAESGIRVELWEHPRPARRRVRLAERLATLGRLPPQPPTGAGPRVIASTTLVHPTAVSHAILVGAHRPADAPLG
ncbi:MAG: metallophosphoesterase [Chloroflexia bacterium]|nr:metallophosphoesterase [Chloroflexia bacterium]